MGLSHASLSVPLACGRAARAQVSDLGQTAFDGQLVEHYRWSDVILKIIKMQTTDFYASFTGATATPVAALTQLTPFGLKPIGVQNQTWTNWRRVRAARWETLLPFRPAFPLDMAA